MAKGLPGTCRNCGLKDRMDIKQAGGETFYACQDCGTEQGVCRFCNQGVTKGDRICGPCNDEKYGRERFGGEVPAGVDW